MEIFIILVLLLFIPIPFFYNIRCVDIIYKGITKAYKSFKPIDIDICKENLLIFDDIMKKHDIEYWLGEGTALGVVRDGDFIPWDDDVDIGMFGENEKKFTNFVLPELRNNGFNLCFVVTENGRGHIFLLVRKHEALDIDFVKPGVNCGACKTKWANCKTCDSLIPYVNGNLRKINFLGRPFMVPGDSYLEYLYGPEWMVPRKQAVFEKLKQLL
jgi:hypothetical protein